MASFDYDVRDHRFGLRRQRRRAPRSGEGLPGRRHGVRQAVERRGHAEEPVAPARASSGSPPRSCTGSRGSSTWTTSSSSPAPAWAADRMSTPTRCTSRRSSSSTPGVGEHHRLGRRAGTASRPGNADARRRPLPVHAHRRRPRHAPGRDRDGTGRDLQQGAGGRVLREPGRRGRRSVLRRGGSAPHRLHLLWQVQHRLRPQRQEQAHDELPLPRGEGSAPRCTSSTRSTTSIPLDGGGFEVHARHPGLGPARGARPPSHLHRRAGDRRGARLWLGEAAAAHAARGPPDRPLERARSAGADELRTAARDHADTRRVEATIRTRSTSRPARCRSLRACGRTP